MDKETVIPHTQESPTGVPRGSLPPLTYRDLPEAPRLRRILGPGVVLAAFGIGSGEFVLWPYIAQQTGLVLLWAALFGAIIMYVIATECVRYTLATGETIITGFTRLWKPWAIGFIILAVIPNIWPGYATGTATTLSFMLGGGDIILMTILALTAIVLSLVLSPVVYKLMEGAMTAMMIAMALFTVLAIVVATSIRPAAWTSFADVGGIGKALDTIPFAVLAGAVAFAGAGGTAVLMASNYVREKGMGMGAYIPRIVSSITGKEEPGSPIGHFFAPDEANTRRWAAWWRVGRWEQFLSFFLLTVVSIAAMSLLAYATVFGKDVGEEFDFIRAEGEQLATIFGPWFRYLFWGIGTVALFSTNLAVWDMIGRITADGAKASFLAGSRFWTESRIYAASITLLFVFSVAVLASGLQAPLGLLVITSVLSGVTSFVYCMLIVQLNRFNLPAPVRMKNGRYATMCVAVLFYLFFFVVTLLDVFGLLG